MTPDVDDMSTGRLIVELAKDVAALAAIVAIIAITVASVAIGAMRAKQFLKDHSQCVGKRLPARRGRVALTMVLNEEFWLRWKS